MPDGHAKGEQVRPEYVVAAVGKVRLRSADAINPKMPTGEIEIEATELLVLNDTRLAPFSPSEEAIQNEEVRLKYRYVDLRRPEMQRNFRLRHDITLAIRDNLSQQGFLEIETPILTKSTPEGARDFLVPSRVHPGEFYALPQSPQIFKQILMISGFDRYFQIARCFRDEDLRADRQLEFTQVDLEMSFPRQETVFAVVEQFLAAGFAAAGVTLPTPFPRISYDDSMRQFGSDKPDLRLPGITDVRPAFTDAALATLQIDPALPVVAFRIPNVGELSRKEREDNHPLFDLKQGRKVHRRLQAAGQGLSRSRRQGARAGRRGRGRLRHHRRRRPGSSRSRPATPSSKAGSRSARSTSTRPQATSAPSWRRNTPTSTELLPLLKRWSRMRMRRAPASASMARRPSIPSGLPTSPCSSTTWRRLNGCRRTIRSPRRTKPT